MFKTTFNKHDILLDESIIELPQDGLYSIHHVVLPTVEWLERVKEEAISMLDEYEGIYISDGNTIGSVILLSKDSKTKMSEVEQKVAQSAANFLGKQMEI